MTTNTNRRAIVFRAPLLPHLFENWRETNTNARRGRMPAVTLNKQNFTAACAAKCPSAPTRYKQQNEFNNLGTSDWKWPRDLGTYIPIPLPAVAIFNEATTRELKGISSAHTFTY